MKPSAMRSLGFTSAARMREDKIKGAAVAMAVDLMKERRERFRVVFISVDLLSLGWWGERSRERLVWSFAPPQGIDETVCNHSYSPCPAQARLCADSVVVASALRADFEPQARPSNKSGHCPRAIAVFR